MLFSFPHFSQVFLISLPTQPYVFSLFKKTKQPSHKMETKKRNQQDKLFFF